jgi:acetyl esterase/lipase
MSQALDISTEKSLEYALHDGIRLTGDLYRPVGVQQAPTMIALHGGGWQSGGAGNFRDLGAWLAARGIAVFSINYRLVKDGKGHYPDSVDDTCAAVRFIRANAERFGLDAGRVGLMGTSAGAHLSALVGLAGDRVARKMPQAAQSADCRVNVIVGISGVYDMWAQWRHDIVVRPRDNVTENYLGVSAIDDKFAYFHASPIAYVAPHKNGPKFLICWGTNDDVVDWTEQSIPFVTALKQAGFRVRTSETPSAPHSYANGEINGASGHASRLAADIHHFLKENL